MNLINFVFTQRDLVRSQFNFALLQQWLLEACEGRVQVCHMEESTGRSLVSVRTSQCNSSHGTVGRRHWTPQRGVSKTTWQKVGLGQWSPVDRQALGGARGVKNNRATNQGSFSKLAFWVWFCGLRLFWECAFAFEVWWFRGLFWDLLVSQGFLSLAFLLCLQLAEVCYLPWP